jgi:hypothetical protein
MDKIDLILFPFVYLFRMTLTVLSLAILVTPSLNQIGYCVELTSIWIVIFISHILLSAIYHLHCILCFTFNIIQKLWLALAFWPRLFWHFFGPSSSGRPIWQIITNANGIPTSPPLDSNQEPIQDNILSDRSHIYDYFHFCFNVGRAHSHILIWFVAKNTQMQSLQHLCVVLSRTHFGLLFCMTLSTTGCLNPLTDSY